MGHFDGKVVAITGAGGGLGRQHALAFAKAGARVVVNDLGSDRAGSGHSGLAAENVAGEIRNNGGEAAAHTESVATREGADTLVATAVKHFGRLDVLVNNAGILRDRTLLNLTEEDFRAVLDVHLMGTFFCSQAAARHLKAQGARGAIVNTTSMSGLLGNFGQANYAAAKAGIYGLTRTMAIELAKYRIRVNAIAPIALTRMTLDVPALQGANETDLGPQWVSPVVVFLASPLADGVNGQIIGVQGRRVFAYRMEETPGVEHQGADVWTLEELKTAWEKVTAA